MSLHFKASVHCQKKLFVKGKIAVSDEDLINITNVQGFQDRTSKLS